VRQDTIEHVIVDVRAVEVLRPNLATGSANEVNFAEQSREHRDVFRHPHIQRCVGMHIKQLKGPARHVISPYQVDSETVPKCDPRRCDNG
jgi:hypothetical protein